MTTVIERADPPLTGDERATLTGFLDYYRATLALKCAGLTPEQLAARATPPSTLSLLGLVRHMAEVERNWFRGFAQEQSEPRYYSDADRDGDFDNAHGDADTVSDAFAFWQSEVEHARGVVADAELDQTYHRSRRQQEDGETISLRWILVHMIEEYARHCGHADLMRETIDGVTGD
ncbi:MAG: Mini-circle protein [Pseudonocardiales bacterium]|nr:MAG: Mini-circle protein [Pseudonocardiales bacterium]